MSTPTVWHLLVQDEYKGTGAVRVVDESHSYPKIYGYFSEDSAIEQAKKLAIKGQIIYVARITKHVLPANPEIKDFGGK